MIQSHIVLQLLAFGQREKQLCCPGALKSIDEDNHGPIFQD